MLNKVIFRQNEWNTSPFCSTLYLWITDFLIVPTVSGYEQKIEGQANFWRFSVATIYTQDFHFDIVSL